MKVWTQINAIIRKDVLSEIRSKESIVSVLVFTLLVIVIFSFTFDTDADKINIVAPGILWVTFAFAGVLSLNRGFLVEKEENCIEGLLACPIPREAIYVGKVIGSLIFLVAVEIIALPIFTLLFNLPVLTFENIVITLLTTIGFTAIGTLFSAMAVNTKAREMVLPILFLPLVCPIIIAAVKASGLVLGGASWNGIITWLQIIIAFDVIFLVASYLLFPFIIEE